LLNLRYSETPSEKEEKAGVKSKKARAAKDRGDGKGRRNRPRPARPHTSTPRPLLPSAGRRVHRENHRGKSEMAFFFRMASRLRPSTPEEVVRSIKDSFLALHTRTHAKVIYQSLLVLPFPCFWPSPTRRASCSCAFFLEDLEAGRSMRTRF
jgi:hypothetical protein